MDLHPCLIVKATSTPSNEKQQSSIITSINLLCYIYAMLDSIMIAFSISTMYSYPIHFCSDTPPLEFYSGVLLGMPGSTMGLLKRCVRKATRKQGPSQFRSGEPCMISILSILVWELFCNLINLTICSDVEKIFQMYRWRSDFQMNCTEKHVSKANTRPWKWEYLCSNWCSFATGTHLERFSMKTIVAFTVYREKLKKSSIVYI